MVSGTTNIVKAQSTVGVNGQGNLGSSTMACGIGYPIRDSDIQSFSFSATGTGGSINSGEFSLVFSPNQRWSGSISGGTFSTTSYQLTGQLLNNGGATCNSAGG